MPDPNITLAEAIRESVAHGFIVSFKDAWPDLGSREAIVVRCALDRGDQRSSCSAVVFVKPTCRIPLDYLLATAVDKNVGTIKEKMHDA